MEQNPKQLALELLKTSKKILLLCSSKNAGSLGSVLALGQVLKNLGKEITIFCSESQTNSYSFLPYSDQIKSNLDNLKDFVISIDTSETQIEKLGYNTEPNQLKIHITPKKGLLDSSKISFDTKSFQFDAIVTINIKKLDELGFFYDQNNEIFFNSPVINIDSRDGNNYFGKINLIDTNATSTSEIIVSIVESLSGEKSLLDKDIATNLLAALIEDTKSFQSVNTTSKAFSVAAQLVGAGADKQMIVQNLYQKKTLAALKLWGRLLAGIRESKEYNIVWSIIAERDLEQTGSNLEDLMSILPDYFISTSQADATFLLWEKQGKIMAEIKTNNGFDASQIASHFGGQGTLNSASFSIISSSIAQAERDILNKIQELKTTNYNSVDK